MRYGQGHAESVRVRRLRPQVGPARGQTAQGLPPMQVDRVGCSGCQERRMRPSEDVTRDYFVSDGWTPVHTGAPDFLLLRDRPGSTVEIGFAEVKTGHDQLSQEQRVWRSVLASFGVRYDVVRVTATGRLRVGKPDNANLVRLGDGRVLFVPGLTSSARPGLRVRRGDIGSTTTSPTETLPVTTYLQPAEIDALNRESSRLGTSASALLREALRCRLNMAPLSVPLFPDSSSGGSPPAADPLRPVATARASQDRTLSCSRCGSSWIPRKDRPIKCPRCTYPLHYEGEREK